MAIDYVARDAILCSTDDCDYRIRLHWKHR